MMMKNKSSKVEVIKAKPKCTQRKIRPLADERNTWYTGHFTLPEGLDYLSIKESLQRDVRVMLYDIHKLYYKQLKPMPHSKKMERLMSGRKKTATVIQNKKTMTSHPVKETAARDEILNEHIITDFHEFNNDDNLKNELLNVASHDMPSLDDMTVCDLYPNIFNIDNTSRPRDLTPIQNKRKFIDTGNSKKYLELYEAKILETFDDLSAFCDTDGLQSYSTEHSVDSVPDITEMMSYKRNSQTKEFGTEDLTHLNQNEAGMVDELLNSLALTCTENSGRTDNQNNFEPSRLGVSEESKENASDVFDDSLRKKLCEKLRKKKALERQQKRLLVD